ncbi:hypothetical protein [Gloeocapsopsis sp. IPPAS B-1203]|uniref:hypothetical protein n=1 Tax=Gloeocapsopsis sp. IPPAS B-1203 TaxID=2049454 RepID=UPI000C191EF4|nr:hypothetical protein [Gloeocapsopsis sp. IPPAS B-1203]PIG92198.1 hypothetical protein CSQ79_16300 [Gloeocapsopsis sp. IPPAS B-1203]
MNSESKFVEPPKMEFPNHDITFLNQVTETVWQLFFKEGKLMVDVPNYSFQIAPDNLNKFRPVNSLVNLEFEFEQPLKNHYFLMHIYAKGIKRATFKAIN